MRLTCSIALAVLVNLATIAGLADPAAALAAAPKKRGFEVIALLRVARTLD
jgi:hypothetical protein